jgi:4-hydroxythreonine-4-phosphate dehydrogenase
VVFLKARDGQYDLVLAMFHDQANMASKLLGFGEVVTLLAGLPIIRTSVGHGTAFDIAGKGIANELNLVCAIKSAAEFAVLKKEGRQ